MADTEKCRRHSVAVMSTSYLPSLTLSGSPVQQRRRLLVDDRATTSSKRQESTVSKAVDRSNKLTKAPPSSVGVPPATQAAAADDSKRRRHSVAVHPGAAVPVMETSGTRQVAAKSSKNSLPLKPTSSKVIDDYMQAADKALMRITPLPAGSEFHRMATLQESASE